MKNVKKPFNHNNSFAISSSLMNNLISSTKYGNFNFFKIFCFSLFFLLASIVISLETCGEKQERNTIHLAWAEEINGTNNADNMSGTINKDIIKGLDGNDTINGKEAGDDISGGSGDDIIFGKEGRDILRGKAGNDRIEGEKGNDRIYGDRGNDILVGGPGNDTLTGGIGRDVFICSTGNDTITDFNMTQNDTTPQQNDCEKIRYDNTEYYISFQQKQEDKQYEEAVDRSVHIENTIEDEKYEQKKSGSNNGFFFGLF